MWHNSSEKLFLRIKKFCGGARARAAKLLCLSTATFNPPPPPPCDRSHSAAAGSGDCQLYGLQPAAACSDAAPAYCDQRHAGGDIVQVQMDQSFTANNHQLNKANPPKGNHHNLKHDNCFIQSQQQLSKILCCDWLKFAEAAGQFSCF